MATLKSLRNRIGAIRSTKKITKAMKLISSAKYLNTKNILKDALPYYQKIEAIAEDILLEFDVDALKDSPFIANAENVNSNKLTLLVVFTSDKGLCGSYNVHVIKALTRKIIELEASEQKYKIFCIGNKGFELIKKHYAHDVVEKITLSLNVTDIENVTGRL
jgi:F-type H+-transporting ATPase subunit gamma